MSFDNIYIVITLIAVQVYMIGHSFIDTYFQRKQEIINNMTEKGDL